MSVTFVSNDYDNYCGNTKKIRLIRAKAIQSTTSSVSFSSVINELLRNNLKK
jgi:hypothetical protein